jgi:hypothetical protein
MDPVTALQRLGGVATYGELMGPTTRSALERAVREDRIVKPCRNRYALVDTDDQVRRAVALGGVLSHLSAALHHDWKVKFPPERMSITVPRSSRTPGAEVEARWADLPDHDVHRHVTRRVRTVTDCARVYDFDVALSVADSALREGEVTRSELVTAAELSLRTGRAKALKVAELASGKRANPFESCLFAIAITVPGLAVTPQGLVPGVGWVDLLDKHLGIVIEAESFEFHGTLDGLRRDVGRYNGCARRGLVVVRFTWDEVMFRPEDVRAALVDVVQWRTDQAAGLHGLSA